MKIPKLHLWIPAFNRFLLLSCLLLTLIILLRVADLASIGRLPIPLAELAGRALWADLLTFLSIVRWIVLPFLLLYMFVGRRAGDIFYITLIVLYVILSFSLNLYFQQTNVPLGADLFGYSLKDIQQTVGAAAGSIPNGVLVTLGVVVIAGVGVMVLFSRGTINGDRRGFWFSLCCLALLAVPLSRSLTRNNLRSEFAGNIALNKAGFFLTRTQQHFFPTDLPEGEFNIPMPPADSLARLDYVQPDKYPFLHRPPAGNALAPFFAAAPQRPNIVVVLVEGLGRAFSGPGAYLGSFTPFLDSLAGHSLYWENFLSAGGRTFAVLPSMMGSLPYARNGFAELAPQLPPSLTLLNLAKHNGYSTRFLYAGDASFDKMDLFVKNQGVDSVIDRADFGEGYMELPVNSAGFTWGYGDAELFRKYLAVTPDSGQPRLDVMLTVSTHSPFKVPDQAHYNQLAEARLQSLSLKPEQLATQRQYLPVYASVLYMDNALRGFFRELVKRADYNNTIVLITGDHRLPEIPMRSKIDRYHTLLLVHSPLLQRPAKFSSVSSHLDVPASFAALLGDTPGEVTWVGSGLDTAREFRNVHQYPLMQTKNDLVDFVAGTWMLNNGSLFRILPNLDLEPATDEDMQRRLEAGFNSYRQKNNQLLQTRQLLPDSLYQRFSR
ncbi:LTA synthase family protein [Chitinophaga lutea]|uniref:LTA synthase family protein n=1 Tax=Chitinophaga lutea TaxID=2488634 RepID=A0A3N4PB83_9BACT|nr:LTA synthase family protein [Chitinophaga lutea]RPE05375.1 LTA synthase family protein [Chitinophaga lutea]